MAYQATVYNVMIASPSDILEEREVIRQVIDRWNTIHSENQKVVLLPVAWETHAIPETETGFTPPPPALPRVVRRVASTAFVSTRCARGRQRAGM